MSDIKFKFWLKDDLEMVYGMNADVCNINNFFPVCDAENIVPLQYTGVKDAIGYEIFEGDQFYLPYINPLGDLDGVDESIILTVVKKHGCFGVQSEIRFIPIIEFCKIIDGEYVSNWGNKKIVGDCYIEVIGNIYESPRLMGAS